MSGRRAVQIMRFHRLGEQQAPGTHNCSMCVNPRRKQRSALDVDQDAFPPALLPSVIASSVCSSTRVLGRFELQEMFARSLVGIEPSDSGFGSARTKTSTPAFLIR